MPIYVFDTDISGFIQEDHPAVLRHLESLAEEDRLVTTIITFNEDIRGWQARCNQARDAAARSLAYNRLQRALDFYCGRRCLPFDEAAVEIFNQLRARDKRIGTNDLTIAAITLAVKGILVTRNFVDFSRIPDLPLEDWTT
jgi:tRNA(fMet)-specific endonuclease VapC